MTVLPKGEWQKPHPDLRECDRHQSKCAYRQGDPERCDGCHADWDAVERRWQDAGPREEHTAVHDALDARVERQRAERVR